MPLEVSGTHLRDSGLVAESLRVTAAKRFFTLLSGPDKWAARICIAKDDDGTPIEWATEWFDTEAAARAALESNAGAK